MTDPVAVALTVAVAAGRRALWKAGVRVSWDGRRITAPPGVILADGRHADLTARQRAKEE